MRFVALPAACILWLCACGEGPIVYLDEPAESGQTGDGDGQGDAGALTDADDGDDREMDGGNQDGQDPCTESNDCAEQDSPFCDVGRGECVECQSDDHCDGDNPFCDAQGECRECMDDTQCGGEELCDPDGECTECLMDVHCDQLGGERCDVERGECFDTCESDQDCDLLERCDPVELRCGE